MQAFTSFSVIVLAVVAACSAPSARHEAPSAPSSSQVAGDDPMARAFVVALLDALERDDLAAWDRLQSAERRGGDEGSRRERLEVWRADVLPLAPTLRRARLQISKVSPQWFVTYQSDGGEPTAIAQVVDEGGALRLDEN